MTFFQSERVNRHFFVKNLHKSTKVLIFAAVNRNFDNTLFIHYSFKPHRLSKQHYLNINNFKEWII